MKWIHLVGLLLFMPIAAVTQPLEQKAAATFAMQCAPEVHPQTLLSIMQTESGLHPYAIHLNGKPGKTTFAKNKQQAIALATIYASQKASFDAGLMQINSSNFQRVGLSLSDLFDPCKNIQAGAIILTQDYENAMANKLADPLKGAISSYNTGHFTRGVKNGYYQKVRDKAEQHYVVPALHPEAELNVDVETKTEQKDVADWDVFQEVIDSENHTETGVRIFN